jgi:N-acetylneuraminic acid mutarotase
LDGALVNLHIAPKLRLISLSLAALFLCAGCILDTDLGKAPSGSDKEAFVQKEDMPSGLAHHASVLGSDGKIHVFGGCDLSGCAATGELNSVMNTAVHYVYDPVKDQWERLANMPNGRAFPLAVSLNDKIYIFGGAAPIEGVGTADVAAVDEYDVDADAWTNCGGTCATDADVHGRQLSGAAAADGKIYVFVAAGGVREFDPALNAWTNCGGTCPSTASAALNSVAAGDGISIWRMGGGLSGENAGLTAIPNRGTAAHR